MNVWQIAMAATGAYAGAIVGACLWLKWRDRKKIPMPPLQRRIPGKPVDGEPLTGKETALLIQIRCGMHDTAADPLEQSGDR